MSDKEKSETTEPTPAPQGNIERMLQAAADTFDAAPTVSREVDEAAPGVLTPSEVKRVKIGWIANEVRRDLGIRLGMGGGHEPAEWYTEDNLVEHISRHGHQLAAPGGNRPVDEAATDRHRLAIDLPEDVYPPERWIREINKTCADLGLAECRIVAVEVDEAAVRASRDEGQRQGVAKGREDTERPAASGKDGAT